MKIASLSELETQFIERVHTMVWCSVATLDTKNRLRSRLLHPIWDGPTGWVLTGRHTPKEKHLEHNPFVSLAYVADVMKPVYVDCTAEWDDDLASKTRVWEMFRSAPPPLGYDPALFFGPVEDPNTGLLKLTPWRIELIGVLKDSPSDKENKIVWRR